MSIFVSRRIPDAGLVRLRSSKVAFELGQSDPTRPIERGDLLAGVRAHDVLLCLLTERVDEELLGSNPRLRGVSVMAVGLDSVDLDAAERLGVPVRGTPNVLTDATADLAMGLLLATARRIPAAHRYMVGGEFDQWGAGLWCGLDVGPGPSGLRKTLGVIGYGRIGRAMARRAAGFDMDVITVARGPRRVGDTDAVGVRAVPFDQLIEVSDFLSLHVPLNRETHHPIGARELAQMRPNAILINTARGPVVDEAALVAALRAGSIAGAGLDVFEGEPEMADGLAELDNVVLLPHIGSATNATRARMAELAVENALELHRESADRRG